MSAREHDSADEGFERLLLDSAQSDELPRNTEAAWQKFDAALRGVSLLAAGTSGALAARRAQRWLAAKWLIWGALAGSAVTALSLRPRHTPAAEPSRALLAPAAVSALPSSAPPPRSQAEVPRTETSSARTAIPRKPAAHVAHPHSSASAAPAAPPASSTLAAQVALLDATRSALANGAYAEALRLADRYRADFPSGELAPEAEVVAIEALRAQGSRATASERAERFLDRYPGDPHAARVKWLVR